MKEYIVTKEILNIRSTPSDTNNDNYSGALTFGTTVFLDETEVKGTIPIGGETDIWKPYNSGFFLAKDGLQLKNYADKKEEFLKDQSFTDLHNNSQDEKEWKVSWGFVDLEIWKIWKKGYKGKGVKVAIIDTGVLFANNDLKDRISPLSVSIINNSIDDESTNKHGTMSAGLIGASGNISVSGLAPDCELIVIRAGQDAFNMIDVVKAIQKSIDLKVDIVSMSLGDLIPDDNNEFAFKEISRLIKDCKDTGPLFLASTGDFGDASIFYPACCDGCFSVGSYNLNTTRVADPLNNRNAFLKFLCPGGNILSCSPTNLPAMYNASSAATAFAAGIMALYISAVGKPIAKYSALYSALQSGRCTNPTSSILNPSTTEGFGILNPVNLITYSTPVL